MHLEFRPSLGGVLGDSRLLQPQARAGGWSAAAIVPTAAVGLAPILCRILGGQSARERRPHPALADAAEDFNE